MEGSPMEIVPLGPGFAAELRGVAHGKVVPADHRLALRNKANQLWHTDSTFKRVPALASVLSARVIPARGGETEYVSTRLAFERLDLGLRKKLENSFCVPDYA